MNPWNPSTAGGSTVAPALWQAPEVARESVTPYGTTTAPAPTALTGHRVNVVAPDGRTFSIDTSELPAVEAQGWKVETSEARGIRQYVEENKGLPGGLKVALRGMLDEATFGVGDVAIDAARDPYELAKWQALKADHDVANIAGRVGGFGLSLLYGGELFGTASHAGGAAARLLGRGAVDAVEHAAGKAVTAELAYRGGELVAGEAAKHGSGVARKILQNAADFGAQGLVLSTPKAMAQAITGDPERAAETWLYGAAGGAALGVPVGLASGIGGKIAARFKPATAASELESLAGDVARAEQAAAAADVMEPAAAEAAKANLDGLRTKFETLRENLAGHHAQLPEYFEAFAQYATGKQGVPLRQIAKGYAEEQAIKAISPYKKYADKLAEMPGGEKAAGRLLLDRGLLPKTNEAVEQYAARLGEHTETLGQKIGAYYEKLSQAGEVVKVKNIVRNLREGVLAPLEKKVGYQSQAAKVRAYIGDLERVHGFERLEGETKKEWLARIDDVRMDVKSLHESRMDLDRLIYGEDASLTADKIADELRAVRRIYSMELDNGIAKAGKSLGLTSEEVASIKGLNREFGAFKTITQAVEKNVGRTLANRSASLSDYVSGAAGAAAGALFGPLGSTVGGVVAGYINNQLRRNANAWLAELADVYARTGAVPDVVKRAYQQAGEAVMPGKFARAVDHAAAFGDDVVGGVESLVGRVAAPMNRAADSMAASAQSMAGSAGRIGKSLVALEEAFANNARQLDRIPQALESLAAGKRALSTPRRDTAAVNVLTRFIGGDGKIDTVEDVMAYSDKLASLASDPARAMEAAAEATQAISTDAPEVAAAAAQKLAQAAVYLYDKAPKAPGISSPFEPPSRWRPDAVAVRDFKARVAVAKDPHSAIDALMDGTLTRAHVETLQALAPKLYDEMIRRVADYAASGKAKPLPYAERLRLSMLTGAPLDRSLAQIAGYQQAFASPHAKDQGGGVSGLEAPKMTTDVQRVSSA